ncbi:MAG: 50S ribosomal protein L18 [Verrucomicrobia bacterium]|nr:50S ribosomal protein L18 [Verrucomicrobiota bacterium]
MGRILDKRVARQRRRWRIRKKVAGTAVRPRVCVFKSNTYLHLQAIDDETGAVVAAASTAMAEYRSLGVAGTKNLNAAQAVGGLLAKRLAERNINAVVFDRSGYAYHGRIKAVAEALRAAKITV